jgi:hypothetical protein
MKKLPIFLLGLLLGTIPTAFAVSMTFSDVSEDAWYYTSVSSLYNSGIVEGYTDNTYRPENSVNRAEMAVMLDKQMNLNFAYDLAHAMVVWSNNRSTNQEIKINGVQIIGSSANAGGYSDATIEEGNIPALAEMLQGQTLEHISSCQEALEAQFWTIDDHCGFLGEIELSDTEFGTM